MILDIYTERKEALSFVYVIDPSSQQPVHRLLLKRETDVDTPFFGLHELHTPIDQRHDGLDVHRPAIVEELYLLDADAHPRRDQRMSLADEARPQPLRDLGVGLIVKIRCYAIGCEERQDIADFACCEWDARSAEVVGGGGGVGDEDRRSNETGWQRRRGPCTDTEGDVQIDCIG